MQPHLAVAPWLSTTPGSFASAVRGGLVAHGVGPAFLSGYRAALASLVPSVGEPLALAATEDGRLHPGRIATTLRVEGGVERLTGRKRYVTGVPGARWLVVLATAGRDGDRQRLVAALVDARAQGVTMRPMPPPPFVPEIPHAQIELDGVVVHRRLPGDGWADVVRPFRTVEDVHVVAAISGYLLSVASRSGWSAPTVAALSGVVAGLSAAVRADPAAAGTHLALAGLLEDFGALVDRLPWELVEPEEAARWRRDRPLLEVAQAARIARLERAWGRLGGL